MADFHEQTGTHITLDDGAFIEDLGHRDQKARKSRRLGSQGSTCLSTGPAGMQDNKSPYDGVHVQRQSSSRPMPPLPFPSSTQLNPLVIALLPHSWLTATTSAFHILLSSAEASGLATSQL
ncbi:hypothetical protein CVT26_008721 [Gymnopilus dilepis]|uniref:Uncharacterized protein n=1 Tax=Gymnopilus dilepis TaxID=231916 RepID=A0A409YG82_9AGAR|nr:hypothetical protein CVT26_008721 [Gymnopilus dilepis]